MMKLNFVTLENGIDYMIIDQIEYQSNKYIYLVNENDSNDFCIRKIIRKDDEEMLSALDSTEEFALALKLFNKR